MSLFLNRVVKGKEYWVVRPAIAISKRDFIMEVVKFKLVNINYGFKFSTYDCEINGIEEEICNADSFDFWDSFYSEGEAIRVAKENNKRILEQKEKEFNRFKEMVSKYI